MAADLTDIDDSATFSTIRDAANLNGDHTLKPGSTIEIRGDNWESIGNSTPFTGTLTGATGATIVIIGEGANDVLNLTNPSNNGFGLFGNVGSGAEFRDLNIIVQANLKSSNTSGNLANETGVLVGKSADVKFINCTITFDESYSLEGSDRTGGLVGNIVGTGILEDCSVKGGFIEGDTNVGGLVGFVNIELSMDNCYSTSNIKGVLIAGGLVGYYGHNTNAVLLKLINCYSTGNVDVMDMSRTGGGYGGGLVGTANGGESSILISDCYSTGTINVGSFGGGLVGLLRGAFDPSTGANLTISDCYSTSSVYAFGINGDGIPLASGGTGGSAGAWVGGLIGFINSANCTISDSYAAGKIISSTGGPGAGGLIGSIQSLNITVNPQAIIKIENCGSFVGEISAPSLSGPIIGSVSATGIAGTGDNAIDESVFDNILVWDKMKGIFDSNDSSILEIFDNTDFLNRNNIINDFQGAGWLDVFIQNTATKSGGSGTGGATISNNNSTPAIQSSVTDSIPPTTTPSPDSNNSSQSGNDNGPLQSGSNDASQQSGSSSTASKTGSWIYVVGIVLAIAIIGGVVYFVKFKK